MKILFLTSGPQVPSTRFRILQYIPGLEARGHVCQVAHSIPPKYRGWPLMGNRASEIPRTLFRYWDWLSARSAGYDVIVLEREISSGGSFAIERLFRRLGVPMVLDVDDAIFLPHPEKFEAIAKMCDAVIAGNSLLEEKTRPFNANVVVIPTCVDTVQFTPRVKAPAARPVIGWTGTSHNFKYLEPVAPALRELARTHDFELRLIAERDPRTECAAVDLSGVKADFRTWREETEVEDLEEFDIGLMPLADDEWSRYKCGLKILFYMAMSIPAVASSVGANREIVQHGQNGFLAATTAEWTLLLSRLLGDATFREQIGTAGRRTVQERYSLDANLPQLERVLLDAAARR